MAETITREAWLRLELEAARDYVARFRDSSDPIEQAQVSRRLREAQLIEDELGQLLGPAVVTFRLMGPAVEGNNAPPELVKEIIQRYDQIATEYGTEVLVAPAHAASHVITLVGPSQLELPTFNTFAEAASAVIDLSPDVVQAGESLEDHALVHSADLTAATLAALRQMIGAMSRYRIDTEIQLDTQERSASVWFRRDAAIALDRFLKDLAEHTSLLQVDGVMRGFTARGGQFEIETADRVFKGRVPKAMRAAADGIALGTAVHAEIEEITATFQSGDQRVRYRLKTIAGADGEGVVGQLE